MGEGTGCTTEVLAGPEVLNAALARLSRESDDLYLCSAWASSSRGTAEHWQALELGKVRQAVIGVSQCLTEPYVLEKLADRDCLRVIEKMGGGILHAKVIAGVRGDQAQAIVGSSNFTAGGYGRNTELNVRLHGPANQPPISDLLTFIDAQWNCPEATQVDDDWLAQYKVDYLRRPREYTRRGTKPSKPSAAPLLPASCDQLMISWDDYFRLLIAQDGKRKESGDHVMYVIGGRDSWVGEAEACQAAFREFGSFAAMPWEKRSVVAGIERANGGNSRGHFGRLDVAGSFCGKARNEPETIGQFLDEIPRQDENEGKVSQETLRAYLEGMTGIDGIGWGVASRLLAVKRPDLFFPVNRMNKAGLSRIFGCNPESVGGYLQIVQKIRSFPWWESSRPEGVDEERVWLARVALLDVLVYEAEPAVDLKELSSHFCKSGYKRAVAYAYHLILGAAGKTVEYSWGHIKPDTALCSTPTSHYAEESLYGWCYDDPTHPHPIADNRDCPGRIREVLQSEWACEVAAAHGADMDTVSSRFNAIRFSNARPEPLPVGNGR